MVDGYLTSRGVDFCRGRITFLSRRYTHIVMMLIFATVERLDFSQLFYRYVDPSEEGFNLDPARRGEGIIIYYSP